MEPITEEENKKLLEFRTRVAELLNDEYTRSDLYLIRWLRARELNLDKAEEMLRNHCKWRETSKISALLTAMPDPYFTKNFRYWLNGEDKIGRPVLCIAMGDWDVRKVVEKNKVSDFQDYINRLFERIVECILKSNARRQLGEEPITNFVCLIDWSGFTAKQTASLKAMQAMIEIAKAYEANYPEILGKSIFLNTNSFFQIFFGLCKPILAPRTLSKIEVYGSDRSQWEPIVRAVVEEHQIPRQFGG